MNAQGAQGAILATGPKAQRLLCSVQACGGFGCGQRGAGFGFEGLQLHRSTFVLRLNRPQCRHC